MSTTRPLAFLAAALSLFLAACSQPSDGHAPMLEPQLGSPDTFSAVGVAFNKAGHLYSLTESSRWDTVSDPDESYEEVHNQQATLHRFDRNGNALWQRNLYDYDCQIYDEWTECGHYRAMDVAVDGGGNAYGLTYAEHSSCDAGLVTYSSYVSKLNTAGTELWSRDVASASAFAVDVSGNVYTVGSNDTGYGEGCDGSEHVDPPYAELVRKYNTNGALLWERRLAAAVGTPTDVAVSGSGSVYIVGSTGMSRYSGSGSLAWAKARAAQEVAVSGSNLYTRAGNTLRRLDGSGNQLWSKSVSGFKNAESYKIAGDTGGNLYLAGKFTSSSTGDDAFVRKYSGSGSLVWSKGFGTHKYDDARGVASYDGSQIYVAGTTQGLLTEANRSGSDGYLRKMDRYGNRVWTR